MRLAAIGAVPVELALVECENSADVEAVKAILEARKTYQIEGGAFYPETVDAWNNAQIIVRGNYVALILVGDFTDTVIGLYNELFN